jgi:hypothetical protein
MSEPKKQLEILFGVIAIFIVMLNIMEYKMPKWIWPIYGLSAAVVAIIVNNGRKF